MTARRPPSLTTPPAGYADWLAELKTRIHSAQQRSALAVNRELVLSLRDSAKPMGVAEYPLIAALRADLQTSLPTIAQIEQALGSAPGEGPGGRAGGSA